MNNQTGIKILNNILLIPVVMAFSGCQTAPSKVDDNFGSSVRHVVAIQTARPGQETPSLDGEKADAVLQTYRKDVAKPEKVERDLIRIDLGK